jgi:RNA repair, ligase-Pnkp-associating, region of Hen1
MLLTISSSHSPANDLGYLPHKNPGRIHTEDLSFGKAHVFYPEADVSRCTVTLLLEVDPSGLVRGRKRTCRRSGQLQHRPIDQVLSGRFAA